MNRKELVAKLERVAPALSTNDLVPILTHFCFSGDDVFAFNEQIGIVAPCKTTFEGAVAGNTLLNLLKASRAKEVEFEEAKGGELIVRAASSRFKLGLLPPDRFVWKPPTLEDTVVIGVDTKKFMAGISACMRSVSIDTSIPDQLGVTLLNEGDVLSMYATDNATLSHARVALKKSPKNFDRVILSGSFCNQMLALSMRDKPLHLEVREDCVLLAGVGGTMLFGSLIVSPKPIDFPEKIEGNYPPDADKLAISIPTKLELILERACIVSAANGEPVKTEIFVEGGVARFLTSSRMTSVRDSVQLEGKHKDVVLAVNPKLLRNGYGSFDRMLITSRCFIMASEDAVYLVAAE
jgi:DNA polymerase III sliding clamp (beta) subunit (PCNA family)